jgi:hypothetical protein
MYADNDDDAEKDDDGDLAPEEGGWEGGVVRAGGKLQEACLVCDLTTAPCTLHVSCQCRQPDSEPGTCRTAGVSAPLGASSSVPSMSTPAQPTSPSTTTSCTSPPPAPSLDAPPALSNTTCCASPPPAPSLSAPPSGTSSCASSPASSSRSATHSRQLYAGIAGLIAMHHERFSPQRQARGCDRGDK